VIGSVSSSNSDHSSDPSIQIRPIFGRQSHLSADKVFTSTEDYTRFLADLKRRSWVIGSEESDIKKAQQVIDKFEAYTLDLWKKFKDPAMRRCTIKHEDLNPHNVHMTPDGEIAGIVDWEFQAVLPAVLCVGVPSWLTDADPDFDPDIGETFSLVSPEELPRLRKHYENVSY
jgi:Ser/Thr protein kinase RdoA (MazF antagonist)